MAHSVVVLAELSCPPAFALALPIPSNLCVLYTLNAHVLVRAFLTKMWALAVVVLAVLS
jgi:hypothetical protein